MTELPAVQAVPLPRPAAAQGQAQERSSPSDAKLAK
jgi:hypothetical protein